MPHRRRPVRAAVSFVSLAKVATRLQEKLDGEDWFWRRRFRSRWICFKPRGRRNKVARYQTKGRTLHFSRIRQSQRRQAIHGNHAIERHAGTWSCRIGGCIVIGHLGTVAHLRRLDLRKGCRIRSNLDKESEAKKDQGQGTNELHRPEIVGGEAIGK